MRASPGCSSRTALRRNSVAVADLHAARAERLALALSAVIALAIAVLTLMPGEAVPDAPGGDKVHHFVAFGALVLPVVVVRPRHALWAVPLAIGYGGAIELIQPHVGRHGEWADAVANALGACMGAALGWGLHRGARLWLGR